MADAVAAPVVAPTETEIKESSDKFLAKFFEDTPVPAPEGEIKPEEGAPAAEVKPEEKPAATPAATSAEVPPADGIVPDNSPEPEKPAAAPAATVPPVVVPPVNPFAEDDIAERVAQKILDRSQPAAPAAPQNPDAKFSTKDQRTLQAMEHLETMNPERKGLAQKTREFLSRELDYKSNWLKEHPEGTFNPADTEHEEFYAKFEPRFDQDELDDAKTDLRARAILKEEMPKYTAPLEQRARQVERAELEREVRPEIERQVSVAVADLVTQSVPEFKALIPNNRITGDSIKQMREKDPEAFEIVNREAAMLQPRIRELEALDRLGDQFELNPSLTVKTSAGTVRPHADIINVGQDIEEEWLRKPANERVRDGRQFVTQAKMQEILNACKGDAKRIDYVFSRCFTIGIPDIRAEFVRRSSDNVKNVLEITNKRAQRVAGKVPANGETAPQPTPAVIPATPARTTPPSTASSSDNVDSRIPSAPAAPKVENQVVTRMFA